MNNKLSFSLIFSQNMSNTVYKSRGDKFSNLCRLVLRRTRYIEKIIVYPTGQIPKNQESADVILRTGDDESNFHVSLRLQWSHSQYGDNNHELQNSRRTKSRFSDSFKRNKLPLRVQSS